MGQSSDSSNNKLNKSQASVVISELPSSTTAGEQDLLASIFTELKKSGDAKAIKLSFNDNPLQSDYAFIYKHKTSTIPNALLKRIRDTEELIGGIIIPLKANQISLFGRPRPNRFDIGFTITIKPEIYQKYDSQYIEFIKSEVVPAVRDVLLNCGYTTGLKDRDKVTFSQFLKQIVEDVYTFGWWAVEVRRDATGKFHSFRAIDAGTIYYAAPSKEDSAEAEAIRQRAYEILNRLEGHQIPPLRFAQGDYTWVQVIDEQPYQVFTDDQLLVWSLSPSTDINRFGYPNNILERVINSITMHINLTTHNKLFFLHGRAARSILVFKSNNLDEADIALIRQQMSNHINSAGASWRMPVFGISPTDDITTLPLDGGGRDMEFTYLADLNKRILLAAFQVSPDEIAALSYLSRGTASQSMAEANNEWKLLKSQESGLRPLIHAIEDFINLRLLPKINPEWANLIQVYFEGLDADTPEKEAVLLSQATSLYFTFNQILDKVEMPRVKIGGDFPLNAAYLQVLEKYYTMGEILETFDPVNHKGASKDPKLAFYSNNPAWFQYQELLLRKEQMQMQQAQMQQMAQLSPPQSSQPAQTSQNNLLESIQQMHQQNQNNEPKPEDVLQQDSVEQQDQAKEENTEKSSLNDSNDILDSAIEQLSEALNKSEQKLPYHRKELLQQHKRARKIILENFKRRSQESFKKIMEYLSSDHAKQHEHCDNDECKEHSDK